MFGAKSIATHSTLFAKLPDGLGSRACHTTLEPVGKFGEEHAASSRCKSRRTFPTYKKRGYLFTSTSSLSTQEAR